MLVRNRIGFLLFVLLCSGAVLAQENSSTRPNSVSLNVVVTEKSGAPVAGLSQQDFTVLDNSIPQTIHSFRALGHGNGPSEVIIVIDAINAGPETVAYERVQIDKFLAASGAQLPNYTTFALVTDAGTQIHPNFTTNSNALRAALDDAIIGMRRRGAVSTGKRTDSLPVTAQNPGSEKPLNEISDFSFEELTERFQFSLKAMEKVTAFEAARSGRKLVVWVSPGWPLLSTPGDSILFTSEQRRQMFASMVNLSTQLRKSQITIYSVDPLGLQDVGIRTNAYASYLKGVSKPSNVEAGNLGLQVFAIHSGGLVLNSGNDLAELLQKCLADTEAYYEITFEPPVASQSNEFHHLEIKVANPKLKVRTFQNYYAQPPSTSTAMLTGPA